MQWACRSALAHMLLVTASLLMGSCNAQDNPAMRHPHIRAVRTLLAVPEQQIDFAIAKITIDKLIDPRIDAEGTLQRLEAMAAQVRDMMPPYATSQQKAETLRLYLYEAGPWNQQRPFQYDFSDPNGTHVPNKLLANYMRTRKGNCVSMPFLFIALGQKLGLHVRAATAPQHIFVKFKDDSGSYHNLETTSNGAPRRDSSYHHDSLMTPKALANGIYMRPLSKKETVLVMVTALMEHHSSSTQPKPDLVLALTDLVLEHDPRSIDAVLRKGYAYHLLIKQKYESQYATPRDIPAHEQAAYGELRRQNKLWYDKAETLGWRLPDNATRSKYMDIVRRAETNQR